MGVGQSNFHVQTNCCNLLSAFVSLVLFTGSLVNKSATKVCGETRTGSSNRSNRRLRAHARDQTSGCCIE